MPGEIATYLLGAQGGVADDFARLHAATNPVLLRYLRVTADGDHAELARTAWVTVLPQLPVCPPDEDAWFELVVGAARAAVLAGDGAASLAPAGTATAPSDLDTDPQAQAIAALRACPPAEAEVLAMGAVASLGRAAMSRLTGLEPAAILALVLQGQHHLPVSLEHLIGVLRAPGTAAEVADLPFAAGLFAAGSPVALVPPVRHPAALPGAAVAVGGAPTAVVGTSAVAASAGPLHQAAVVDIHSLQSSAPASAQRVFGTPSRSARAGAAAAAWLLAVGGISTAAAMSGLLSVAIDGILGRDRGPLVTAEGPVVPGPLPTTEPPSGGPSTGGPPTPNGGPTDPPDSAGGGTVDDTVTLPGGSGGPQVVVASFDDPDPSTPSSPTTPTPTEPPVTPRTPVAPTTPNSPRPVVPTVNDDGKAKGKGHAKHQGKHLAKGHAKAKSHAHPGKHLAKGHAHAKAKQAKAKQQKQQTGHGKATGHGTTTGHTNKGKH